jgi:hypothetical protein
MNLRENNFAKKINKFEDKKHTKGTYSSILATLPYEKIIEVELFTNLSPSWADMEMRTLCSQPEQEAVFHSVEQMKSSSSTQSCASGFNFSGCSVPIRTQAN